MACLGGGLVARSLSPHRGTPADLLKARSQDLKHQTALHTPAPIHLSAAGQRRGRCVHRGSHQPARPTHRIALSTVAFFIICCRVAARAMCSSWAPPTGQTYSPPSPIHCSLFHHLLQGGGAGDVFIVGATNRPDLLTA